MEKRVVRTVERPTPEEKKEKGLLVKLKMDIGETMEKRIRVGCYGAKALYL